MHEGLDLKGDLSRFQIICKVPYPGLGSNPQLKRRMEISDDYYSYLTALKLVQSYGRSVRSETDWAKTYILDGSFRSFFENGKKMLPTWFKEVIQW
jgi:Rad3-related DNA helicase